MTTYKNGKLLLVEDDFELRETLEEIFFLYDIPFDVAKSASEAKKQVSNSDAPYSLVLSDYLMPGESGLDFFMYLKELEIYREIPFFILSARTEDEVREKCRNAGVTDFIKKPFEMQTLVDLIKQYV